MTQIYKYGNMMIYMISKKVKETMFQINPIKDREERPPTNFYPITSTNLGVIPPKLSDF